MYCPKCAAPIDGVKFCRQCGVNVSLIPQALTGQLPVPSSTNAMPSATPTIETSYGRRARHRGSIHPVEPPSMANAFNRVLAGLGFLAAAAIVMRFSPGGMSWGWALIFPAMGMFGKAVSDYYRVAEARQSATSQQLQPIPMVQPVSPPSPPQVPTTAELKLPAAAQEFVQPVSITEPTTALLDPARPKVAEKS